MKALKPIAILLLVGCAQIPYHQERGSYRNLPTGGYEFQVSAGGPDPHATLERAAYEICSKKHSQGFKIANSGWILNALDATVHCQGSPNPALEKRFQTEGKKFESSPSELTFKDGFEFEIH